MPIHPLAMTKVELIDFLKSLAHLSQILPDDVLASEETPPKKTKKKKTEETISLGRWQTQNVALPTEILSVNDRSILPIHSGTSLSENANEETAVSPLRKQLLKRYHTGHRFHA